ncbi:M15 family metallopeptidase [Ruminococcus flavefaciens]|jgi:D-alanyl-D-alanine carboxypeptidase|uniref:M15 family metallopeptidase n=1 Tax=Ruminococcus flavefaciens TaxID=1265 RepID=UPI000491518E|nr:M15 family metallopeptidase [Ruminococcus flavefaciens]
MANGDKRRNRKRDRVSKRYKVRYDRLVAVVLVLVVLLVVLGSCCKSCSKKDNGKTSGKQAQTTITDNTQQSSIVDNLTSNGETSSLITGTPGDQKPSESQYTTEVHKADDVNRGNLILVNSAHEYKFIEGDTELEVIYYNHDDTHYHVSDLVTKLDTEALDHLNQLMDGFYDAETNSDIYVIGAYRTAEEQDEKYNYGNSQFQGGYSDYHTGRSFDLGIFPTDGSSSGYYMPTGVYGWIDEHAAEYGFVVRFPEGKDSVTGERQRDYTYRYVGVPHAVYMKQNKLCLEEYIDKIKEHTNESPLEVTVGNKLYQIYYAAANATGDTEVPVPSNKTYTVSGNNVDGFIITVSMN